MLELSLCQSLRLFQGVVHPRGRHCQPWRVLICPNTGSFGGAHMGRSTHKSVHPRYAQEGSSHKSAQCRSMLPHEVQEKNQKTDAKFFRALAPSCEPSLGTAAAGNPGDRADLPVPGLCQLGLSSCSSLSLSLCWKDSGPSV